MYRLDSSLNFSVQLGGAVTLHEMIVSVSYSDLKLADGSLTLYKDERVLTNGASAQVVLAAPSAGYVRQIKRLEIINADTVVGNVYFLEGANIIKGPVALDPNNSLVYEDAQGWMVYDETGAIAQNVIAIIDSPTLVNPSVTDHIVTFGNTVGEQKDSGIPIANVTTASITSLTAGTNPNWFDDWLGFYDASAGGNRKLSPYNFMWNPSPGVVFFCDMTGNSGAINLVFLSSGAGSSCNNAGVLLDATAYGVIGFGTGTTTSGYSGIGSKSNSVFFGSGRHYLKARFYIPTLSAAAGDAFTLYFGYVDQSAIAPPANYATMITYTDNVNSGKFQCETWNGAANKTLLDSGVTVATNTWYTCEILVNAAGTSVSFYINNSTTPVATTALNIPAAYTKAMGPRLAILKTAGTTDRELYGDHISGVSELTTPRP